MNARRPAIRALFALVVMVVLPACFAGRFAVEADSRFNQALEPSEGPEIDLWIRGAGDDAIDVYLDGSAADRRDIAEGVAAWLGFRGVIAHDHDFYPDTSTVQIEGRLIGPGAEDEWVLDLDTRGLSRVLSASGYDLGALVICTPPVETRLRATRPPDLDHFETICDLSGRGWTIVSSDPEQFTIRLTLLPDAAYYLAYAAGVLLGTVLIGALAWWLGNKLRSGPFRRRSPAAVVIGLIAGSFAAIGMAGGAAGAGAVAGPADNLALARDFTIGGYVGSLMFPALIASAPGIIFAVMLVRRRPWAEDEQDFRSGAPPAPPGPPGPPGPPPLPWSSA